MEAIRNVPRVLQNVEELRASPDRVLQEYKQQVAIFLKEMARQVSALMDKYALQISNLERENARLRGQIEGEKVFMRTAARSNASPRLEQMATAKSQVLGQGHQDDELRFSQILSKIRKSQEEDNQFPVELINPERGSPDKSRYEVNTQAKKLREQELLHCLEAGRKNLDYNTGKFLGVIGRSKGREEAQEADPERDKSQDSKSGRKEDGLNQSLGHICNSLDTSYISKKSRSERRKKVGFEEEQKRRKKAQEQEVAKMVKERGLKSLLQRLRDNVESSPTRAPETIKTSKLISCGNEKSPMRKSSKVFINPVPVDIAKRGDKSNPSSPERRPTSILKQTSAILTRSLSGISAIDFKD